MGIPQAWFVILCVSSCTAASVSENLVVVVSPPVSEPRGHTATLPCWLNPPQSAEALEVRWYRSHFDTPILHYRESKLVGASKEASYVGRVSFGLKDGTSGGLRTGDVTLKLTDVTINDAGTYSCYVSSDRGYDSATVNLSVTETGSNPLLSVVWKENNMVNVSCDSEGWYPQPVMRWSDQKGNLSPANVVYREDKSGLHSVHGWVFVPSNSEVSCSVGLHNEEAKEGRFHLGNPEKQEQSDYGSGGWVAFGLLCAAIAIAAVLGVMYIKKRGRKSTFKHEETEGQPLMPRALPTVPQNQYDPSQFNNFYVNITLEDPNNQCVIVRGTKLREANLDKFPDGETVTCLTVVRGTSGFSSGQHYWEVSLKSPNIDPKQSWWVGVTNVSEITHEAGFSPNTSNGFWFLSSSPDIENKLQVSTKPRFSLPVHVRPCTLGVYLNYDSGELSFYNVEEKSLIGYLTATFTGEVFPFFNPGKGDRSVMEILHRKDTDTGNHVDQPEQG